MSKIRLDDIDKNLPFQAPEGYFEKLSTDILERKSELSEKRSLVGSRKVRLALVTSFVVVLASFLTLRFLSNEGDVYDQYLSDVSNEDIVAYLASTELSELELLEMMNDDVFIDFGTESDALEDIELDDESIDDLYLEYGITDELMEI